MQATAKLLLLVLTLMGTGNLQSNNDILDLKSNNDILDLQSNNDIFDLQSNNDIFDLIAHADKNGLTVEVFCKIVALTKHHILTDEYLNALAEKYLDTLLSGELDCFDVAEYCHEQLKHSTDIVKMMILKLIKRYKLKCKVMSGKLILGTIKAMWLDACPDYYEMAKIDDERWYMNFESVHIRSKLYIDDNESEHKQIAEICKEYFRLENFKKDILNCNGVFGVENKMNTEYSKLIKQNTEKMIGNKITSLNMQATGLKSRKLCVLLCLIGMLKSEKHRITFENEYMIKSSELVRLVGVKNINGIANMRYNDIKEIFGSELGNIKHMEHMPVFHNMHNNTVDLAPLIILLEKTKLETARIELPVLHTEECIKVLAALKEARIEVLKIVKNQFINIIEVLDLLKGKSVKSITLLNRQEHLRTDGESIKVIEKIKEGLLGIDRLESVDLKLRIEDFMHVGLDRLVKELKLKYIGIGCTNCGLTSIEEFIRSVIGTVNRIVVYAGNFREIVENIAKKVLNEIESDRIVEIVVVESYFARITFLNSKCNNGAKCVIS